MGFFKYLKAAFLERWNLLAFAAGLGFAFMSGQPDILLPLVLAGEIGYLSLLGSHSKFQRAVDASQSKEAKAVRTEGAEKTLRRILRSLPKESINRFEALRSRCLELRQIAVELKDPGTTNPSSGLEELQLAGLDKLLWIFMRLLFTRYSLERFLAATRSERIQSQIKRLEDRLQTLSERQGGSKEEKMRNALEDNLTTSRSRLDNLEKARDNLEIVELEIDRLENKIRSLSELAINRQEPEFISGQVDQVASSLINTERTMSELEFATGLEGVESAVPEFLEREKVKARR